MSVRLLADENVPGPAVDALRHAGHDVAWMHEDAPGVPDLEVPARAQQESRVLVTFDKDFGALAFRAGAAAAVGVVLFRVGAEFPTRWRESPSAFSRCGRPGRESSPSSKVDESGFASCRVVILRAFVKKTETPTSEIDLALQRARELKP